MNLEGANHGIGIIIIAFVLRLISIAQLILRRRVSKSCYDSNSNSVFWEIQLSCH